MSAHERTNVYPVAMVHSALDLAAQVEERRDPATTTVVAACAFGSPDGPGIAAADSDHGVLVVFAESQQQAHDRVVQAAQVVNGLSRTDRVEEEAS